MTKDDYSIVGKKFGRLTVIEFDHRNDGHDYWLCECDCGNKKVVRRTSLMSGNTSSCGCLKHKHESLIGRRFGRLTVLKYDHSNVYGETHYSRRMGQIIYGFI